MTPNDHELVIARSLDDYLTRRSWGEVPDPEDYRPDLGESYPEFLDALGVESTLEEVLEPPMEEPLPREFGRYTLLRELGRGASGIVYEALNRELGRHEAVKVLRPGYAEECDAFGKFRREAYNLAKIRHPNIVDIYANGEVGGRPYYSMTLVEGVPLHKCGREGSPRLTPQEACLGLAGVAGALQVLHDQGMVHRDVKPQNILVRKKDGEMILADFGLARRFDDIQITRTGQVVGTLRYMSPEQLRGDPALDGRADVYSLGATLYEVLADNPHFPGNDLSTLYDQILHHRPTALRRVAPSVPESCENIALTALEKRPEARQKSAADMRDSLSKAAVGQQVPERPGPGPATDSADSARTPSRSPPCSSSPSAGGSGTRTGPAPSGSSP